MQDEVIACPWHGLEYHVPTGRCLAYPEITLRRYPVDGARRRGRRDRRRAPRVSSLPVAGRLAVVEEADRVLVVREDDPSDWLCAFAKAGGFPAERWAARHGAHLQRAAGAQSNIQPPSTSSVWPLTKLESSLAKNAIARATSSTSPRRLID